MDKLSRKNCPSLSQEQISSLNSQGITTLMDFVLKGRDDIIHTASLTLAEYEALHQILIEYIRPTPVAATQLVDFSGEPLLPTGIGRLDEVLGGGLGGGELMEIYGLYGTGKTQLCLAIAAQFCHFHEEKFSVVYFDLKNDFRASRFLKFCEDERSDLTNIQIIRSSSLIELISDLDEIKYEVSQGQSNFYSNLKLVILDSVPMVIYPAIEDDSQSWRFHQEVLVEKATQLTKLNNGIVFIFVNHAVKSRINQKSNAAGNFNLLKPAESQTDLSKPAMGTYWIHKVNFRLYVSRNSDCFNLFTAVLEKSTRTESMKTFDFTIESHKIESY